MRVNARKRFGQHFLINPQIAATAIDAIEAAPGNNLLEVGPGTGALTETLVKTGASLTAVELDRDLAELLRQKFKDATNFNLVEGDILLLDWHELMTGTAKPWRIITNLPYNISTPFLFKVISHRKLFNRLVILLQKEFAGRLTTTFPPRHKEDYGSLTVVFSLLFQVRHLADAPPEDFSPPPNVHSSLICIEPKPDMLDLPDEKKFLSFVHEAFRHKRKYFKNFLSRYLSGIGAPPSVMDSLSRYHLLRPEQIPPEDFISMFQEITASQN